MSPLVLDGGRPAPLTVILVSGNTAALAVPRSTVDGSMLPWGGVVRLEFTVDHDVPPLASYVADLTDSGSVARWELTPIMVAEVGGAQHARITVDGQSVAAGRVTHTSSWAGQSRARVSTVLVSPLRGKSTYDVWRDAGGTGGVAAFLAEQYAGDAVSLVEPADVDHPVVDGLPAPVVRRLVRTGEDGLVSVVHVHSQASVLHGPAYDGLDGRVFYV